MVEATGLFYLAHSEIAGGPAYKIILFSGKINSPDVNNRRNNSQGRLTSYIHDIISLKKSSVPILTSI